MSEVKNDGRSVRLFLVDGTSTGIITAEIMNWTGHILAAPRTRLDGAMSRDELKRTGVYILIGPDDENADLSRVYIGEGDDIGKRLYDHNRNKDFWERFIAITSKDMNLTKAHVRFLEGRLLELLKSAKKVKIDNKDMPQFGILPEADIADMSTFLNEIQLVLPVIGADFLRRPIVRENILKNQGVTQVAVVEATLLAETSDDAKVYFTVENIKAGINARAMEDDGEFIILAGSRGSLREKSSFNDRIQAIRNGALSTGRVRKVSSEIFEVDDEISFTSPSAAAVFLFGTSRNGRTDWLVETTSETYGAWKDRKIERNLAPNSEE